MFQDLPSLLKSVTTEPGDVSDAMEIAFAYCDAANPANQPLWRELRLLDFNADLVQLTEWIVTLLRTSPVPGDISALWFGLYNPCDDEGMESSQFYCSGSRTYAPCGPCPDWHCSTDYIPEGRYATSTILPELFGRTYDLPGTENYLGGAVLCHSYLAATLAQWCRDTSVVRLLNEGNIKAVAFGHDSGDVYFAGREK